MYEIINIYKGRAGQRSAVRGFTLVEVALSLLVISVGIVVLVGLFPAGLKANKASIDETRMALFAEEVLNGVRAASRDIPWDWLVNDGPFFSLPAPAPDIWKPAILNNLAIVAGEVRVNNYVFSDAIYDEADITAYALRYRLDFKDVPPSLPMVKEVTLQVWNGEEGPLGDTGRVFYTELIYNGK